MVRENRGRNGPRLRFSLLTLSSVVVVLFTAEADSSKTTAAQLGVLEAGYGNPAGSRRFCVQCYTSNYDFADSAGKAAKFRHSDLTGLLDDACQLSPAAAANKFVFAVPKNCSLGQMVTNVEGKDGLGLLLSLPVKPSANLTATFPVAALVGGDGDVEEFLRIVQDGPDQELAIFIPVHGRFDLSLAVIFAIAMGTIACGSYWSGITRKSLESCGEGNEDGAAPATFRAADERAGQGPEEESDERRRIAPQNRAEDASMKMSVSFVVCLVVVMCSTLILLYFFYSYLVYVIIAMFALASTIGLYECSRAFVDWAAQRFWPDCSSVKLPTCNLYCCQVSLKLYELALMSASIAVVAVWLYFRNSDWAWGLRNFLGFLFCVNMLRVCLMPSMKVCTILMCILFVYDVFFVFITPLFTPNGESIMVEVATGGSSNEALPLVFGVPRIKDEFSVCGQIFSMLGFGDIMVPGLFLSFCHGFDVMAKTPYKCYWIISLISYGLGLGVTFLSLALMNTGQPALLYLVPFTLIPIIITAHCRKELGPMWRGDFENEEALPEREIEGPIDQENVRNGNTPDVEVVVATNTL